MDLRTSSQAHEQVRLLNLKRDLTIGDTRLHLSKTSELDCVRFARALYSENKTKKYKNFATGA